VGLCEGRRSRLHEFLKLFHPTRILRHLFEVLFS
jgi:hypothetical protein